MMSHNNSIIIDRIWSIEELNVLTIDKQALVLNQINKYLESLNAEDRLIWSVTHLSNQSILSSSFGIQSVVSLHLVTRYYPNIPIILIDTGYLFPETYQFIDRLTKIMKLNLHVFRASKSSAWQEARYGKLWEQGLKGIQKYNFINKVLPMQHALKSFKVNVWFSGLRREQSNSRRNLPIVSIQYGVLKFLPIVDWNKSKIYKYIKQHGLERHPLELKGYVSVGDVHTTVKYKFGMKEEETRFFGLQRECGLHVFNNNN